MGRASAGHCRAAAGERGGAPRGRALTADLCDRLEQILSALPVIESRRVSIKAAALFLDSLSRSPLPGEDVNPTITKQAQRETLQRLGSPHLRIENLSET